MAAKVSQISVKDGNANNVVGGVDAVDYSGAGIGPWSFTQVILDGTSGSNVATVNASGQLSVTAVLTTGTAPLGTVTLATGTATVGGVFIVTGTSSIGFLATGTNAIGTVSLTTGTAPIGSIATGSAPIGSLTTGSAPIGSLTTGTAPIGTVSLTTGSAPIGSLTTGTAPIGTVSLTTGSAPIGSLATGSAIVGQVQQVPTTSGGLTTFSLLVLTGSNAQNIKASAGQVYGWSVTNNSTNIAYVKLYDTAGTPTTGSGTPKVRIMIPGNTGGAGNNFSTDNGIAFTSGVGMTTTNGWADTDSTAVATGAFLLNLFYK